MRISHTSEERLGRDMMGEINSLKWSEIGGDSPLRSEIARKQTLSATIISSMYKRYQLFLFGVVYTIGTTSGDFVCLRTGVGCTDDGNKCEANGTCTCTTGSGYDCGLNAETLSNECTESCQNGGSCFKKDSTVGCYCTTDYYGPFCQFKRVSVKCNESGMVVNVNPHGTFQGNIFVFGLQNNASCNLVNIPANQVQGADPGWKGLAQYLPYNNSCGDAQISVNDTMGVYEFKIVTAYNKLLVTSLDELITAKCFIQTGGQISISSDVELSNYGSDLKSTGSVEETFSPIEFKLLTNNTEKKSVKLGDVVSLQFQLSTQSDLNAIRLESCVAETNQGNSLSLVSNGCRTKDAEQLISDEASGEPERSGNDSIVTFKITAFKFIKSNQVNFRCIVMACKDGDTKCEKQCITDSISTRRKRDTITVRKQVMRSLIITDGTNLDSSVDEADQCLSREQLNNLSYNDDSSPTSCFELTEVLAVIVTLSVVLVLIMITVTLLSVRYIRNRQSKVDNLHFKDDRPTFTIPRASVAT
ncbi:hypothetical protein LOTGIDRAFT_235547 [Lottia gigantea]|uniref:ZP domain-containing protein n=1 Tax=Lottia gigantea TaxID=225164 RepID=V3Z5Y8_LOTGI|nr:hypothetical protein LOTGIDRAFT_235547 [Lottia gigantea]ESO86193.1 hypothetical protein LOTGIDRAFT_235547 [Lottia gigantea]